MNPVAQPAVQPPKVPPTVNSAAKLKTNSAEAAPAKVTPGPLIQRVRHFDPGMRVGAIACSPDGKLIAVGNDQPIMIMMTGGHSRVADKWQPAVNVVDAETGKTVVSLKLSSNEEDTVLAANDRVSHFEVKALAFSPDGNVVAVGTSIGQVKLYSAADRRAGAVAGR